MRLLPLSLALLTGQVLGSPLSSLPVKLETRSKLDSHLANIHLRFDEAVEGEVTYTYGSCSAKELRDAHHVVGRSTSSSASRLVWLIPKDVTAGGCLSAWDSAGSLVGRSAAQSFQPNKRTLKKRGEYSIQMNNDTGIDTLGPWFDGVALLESKNLSAVDVSEAKSKEIAIVGAGMAGLMTYLILHQSGFENVKIIEAAQRLGGRVHTEYLNGGPFDYSYQEMGPMRFPNTVTVGNDTYNITDHQMVYQLAEEMNKLNNYASNWSVDFIPWYQSSSNGLSYYDGIKLDSGLPPTLAQIAANASLDTTAADSPSTTALSNTLDAILANDTFVALMATNMHQAHKDFLAGGLDGLPGDEWSEFAFLVNYLKANLNDTDIVSGGAFESSFWDTLYEGMYFDASTWKTINGGLSRLPASFHPLVDNVTTMNRAVERVKWLPDSQKVQLEWREKKAPNVTSGPSAVWANATYDYTVFALPFSVIQNWRLPSLPATITNAISEIPFTAACKVALEFSTRFWEHYENPIYGGCSTSTDIPGIGSICYPSYNINGSGPATMLGSYISGDQWGARWVSVSEEDHVQYVLDAMIEIHGDVAAEQYTGNYNRRCWMLDPYEKGSWASPKIGQHELYIPEYFKTYNNMIFVGEQTSYTHAWIASALESGVRGAIQLLLELGLVDEAKAANEKWNGRWIDVFGISS
ncbi:L-amino-acid oxidase [Seiridium cupressi]